MAEKKDFYEILEISRDATIQQIRAAYKKQALRWHPDRNPGNKDAEEMFKKVSYAYETLSDPEKKKLYDQFGEEGLERGGGVHNAQDIFSNFFNIFGDNDEDGMPGIFNLFGGGGKRREGPTKTRDVVFQLQVPIREFYTGRERKLKIRKQIICDQCNGTGAKKGGVGEVNCADCKGKGMVVEVNQIRPGFISQMQRVCEKCKGKGKSISKEDRCTKCKGEKVVEEPKVVSVQVDKGMDEGEKIVFYGESDQSPGATPGDLIVVLTKKKEEDDTWQRRGEELIYKKTITLVEALTGYSFLLTHLDDRIVKVNSEPGDVIKPGDVRMITGEGMPKYKSPFEKGNLYIAFEIEFPTYEQIRPNVKELQKLLPRAPQQSKKRKTSQNVTDEVVAKPFKMQEDYKRNEKSSKRQSDGEDSSSAEPEEGQRYRDEGRCHQQ